MKYLKKISGYPGGERKGVGNRGRTGERSIIAGGAMMDERMAGILGIVNLTFE